MEPTTTNIELVAYCGLYCGACGAYRRGRCPGCHQNEKATWCKVRSCCKENGYSSCAECKTPSDPRACKKFTNFISKIFGLIFRSDRRACILQIREKGLQGHAEELAARQAVSIRR